MRDRMGSMVIRLQDAAMSLTLASTEILESSSQQSRNASLQAASVTETGATMAELKEIFAQASERAQSVIDLAKKSEDSTTSGRTAVQESVEAMEQIRDEVTHISSTIVGLVERTNQIAVIIDTVNDLAEQSNVLALNAAIEAARAGEHGKGFAVVAREVRSLAKRSKDSTAQVRSILTDIEKASRDAMAVIEEGTRKTQSGMELSSRAGQSIIHLDQAIDASSTAAKQIAASIRQQSLGMEQIWQAMRDVGRSVQESVAGVQALESSSKTMKDLSEEMSELTSAYQVSRRTNLSNTFAPSMPTEPPLTRTEPPRPRTRTQPGDRPETNGSSS
jgi:methyl-accepting chemotaxis protein